MPDNPSPNMPSSNVDKAAMMSRGEPEEVTHHPIFSTSPSVHSNSSSPGPSNSSVTTLPIANIEVKGKLIVHVTSAI